jgi:hypothetical protein
VRRQERGCRFTRRGPRAGLVLYRQQQRDEQDADPGGVRDYDDIDELFETHTSIES